MKRESNLEENDPKWDFRGHCVAVSGGARGIGAGLVRQFARCGATVLFGDIDTTGARQLCEAMASEGRPVHFVEADFTAPEAWETLRGAGERLGLNPDLVIANVGLGCNERVEQSPVGTFDRLLNANVRSAWLAAKVFAPVLEERAGSLLLIGSVMARFGTAGQSLYGTSKAALSGLLRALCVEYGPRGVRVNMIVPGYILNDPPGPYREAVPPELWNEFHARFGAELALANPPVQPLPFWGEPRDIAQAACFLHSSSARYITGVELPVDGGLLCQSPIREGTGNESWAWTAGMRQWLRDRGVEPSSPL